MGIKRIAMEKSSIKINRMLIDRILNSVGTQLL